MDATEEAYLAAFREHSQGLFRYAFIRLRSRDRATDMVQDTFMKVWDYLRAGGMVREYKSFLYRTLRNLIIDESRRKRSESLEAMTNERRAHIEAELAVSSQVEVEGALDEVALKEKVRGALITLRPEHQEVLTLRYIDGFSPKEIAQMIGVSENVVSVRINRGVQKLRTHFV